MEIKEAIRRDGCKSSNDFNFSFIKKLLDIIKGMFYKLFIVFILERKMEKKRK